MDMTLFWILLFSSAFSYSVGIFVGYWMKTGKLMKADLDRIRFLAREEVYTALDKADTRKYGTELADMVKHHYDLTKDPK